MMDASGVYPRGHHPQLTRLLPDISGEAPFVRRIAARPPVKYYYIDFGISSKFSPDEKSRLVYGSLGRDQEVPELSNSIAYDPFKVDIFLIGNTLRQMMHDVSSYSPFRPQLTLTSPEIHECQIPPTAHRVYDTRRSRPQTDCCPSARGLAEDPEECLACCTRSSPA